MKMELLKKIEIPVSLVLGTKKLNMESFSQLKEGTIGVLDALAGEPAILMAGDKPIARAEVVVIDENFGYRITQMLTDEAGSVP